jgi:hypothetical protein
MDEEAFHRQLQSHFTRLKNTDTSIVDSIFARPVTPSAAIPFSLRLPYYSNVRLQVFFGSVKAVCLSSPLSASFSVIQCLLLSNLSRNHFNSTCVELDCVVGRLQAQSFVFITSLCVCCQLSKKALNIQALLVVQGLGIVRIFESFIMYDRLR